MKPHLLIVDDEAPVRFLLSDFFRSRGYKATVASTVQGMWEALDAAQTQLVILDIALEDADGLELLRELKQTHPSLPVMMLTGMGYDDELEREAFQNGAAGYVSKGLPLDQLLMEVHRVLRQAVTQSPPVPG